MKKGIAPSYLELSSSFLLLTYVANTTFSVYPGEFYECSADCNVVFINDVPAISLIILAMTFYVDIVLTFMPKRKIEYVIL